MGRNGREGEMGEKETAKKTVTWHGGLIPDNEIWVKLGRESFKMSLQLVNTRHPNSILCFQQETPTQISTETLQTLCWRYTYKDTTGGEKSGFSFSGTTSS